MSTLLQDVSAAAKQSAATAALGKKISDYSPAADPASVAGKVYHLPTSPASTSDIATAVALKLLGTSSVQIKITSEGYVYAAREDGTPLYYTLGSTTYGSRSDIEDIFGIENVKKWALLSGLDPTSVEGQAEISGRVARALTWASADIDNRLREGGYIVPVTSPGAAATMVVLGATKAGVWLYENRGTIEFHPETGQPEHRYMWKKKEVEQTLDQIRAGKYRLDAARPSGASTGPIAQQSPHYSHEDHRNSYGSGGGLNY